MHCRGIWDLTRTFYVKLVLCDGCRKFLNVANRVLIVLYPWHTNTGASGF